MLNIVIDNIDNKTLESTRAMKSEKGGFEPPDPGLAGQLLSREPDSASLAPLQIKKTEREGFEPPDTCASTVFKTASFDRSDISPFE